MHHADESAELSTSEDHESKTLTPETLILWVGPKHSGKTSGAARLVQAARARGFTVAGCLAPSLYARDRPVGFDILDIRTGKRVPWARSGLAQGKERTFRPLAEGLELGAEALSPTAVRGADLVIIDEYGPWEFDFKGWRVATDRLMTSTDGVLLLVVREELAEKVRQLYRGIPIRTLLATQERSLDEALAVLVRRRSRNRQCNGNPWNNYA